jgi:uncharacterized protein with NRDE domain
VGQEGFSTKLVSPFAVAAAKDNDRKRSSSTKLAGTWLLITATTKEGKVYTLTNVCNSHPR